ncbi:PEBP-like protein [Linderina pennispora]|uniref:PEBP-like protein n=1 Tax=Linderina pennispora TaxID=61395 RepID=A0A1Y1WI99_9FUNG|nr:PEBP-like protein [Linderina pennispora]ORX73202.1 PEBP-like protein [Linderina pennispora]
MRSSAVLTALTCALGVYAAGGVNYDFASPLIGNLESTQIIPDVFPATFEPKIYLNVTYNDDSISTGEILTPADTAKEPTVVYEADPSKFYTLAFLDAGDSTIPNRSNDLTRNWLVVNIPGSDIAKGSSTGTPYMGTKNPDCGMTRYVYALAEQPKEIPNLTVSASRDKFDLMGYFNSNKMTMVGANFIVALTDSNELCPGASLPSHADDFFDESASELSSESSVELGSLDSLDLVDSAESSTHSASTSTSSSGAKTTQPNSASGNSPNGLALSLIAALAMVAVGSTNYF